MSQEKKFDRGFWIDLWRSDDLGQSFAKIATPVPISRSGNPPTLTLLADDRLALVYGWRLPPYGVRARFSSDDGCAFRPLTDIRLRCNERLASALHSTGDQMATPS